MRLLFDCTPETMYPLAKEGFSGGSQTYVKAISHGLASRGHDVHIIANDLAQDEQRGPNEHWWPKSYYPHTFDVAVMQMHVRPNPDYEAPVCVLMTSCIDPYLGPEHTWAEGIDAFPLFSEVHKQLLLQARPTVSADKCFITGLGVDLDNYPTTVPKIPGRMLYANDPCRGLFYVMDIFDLVKKQVPEATLHVAYNFDLQLSWRQWEHSQMAELLWDCKRRMETTPGMVNVGGLDRNTLIREELECQVHCMPSDPPGRGTQTHGITQLECAAAGCALVLSDIEAFPEVFGEGAILLPVIGKYLPELERRTSAADYAEVVVELMQDKDKWLKASQSARVLAEQHTWSRVVDNWESMLTQITQEVCVV